MLTPTSFSCGYCSWGCLLLSPIPPFSPAFQGKQLFGFSHCSEKTVHLNPKSWPKKTQQRQEVSQIRGKEKCMLVKISLKNKIVQEPKLPNFTWLLVQLYCTKRHLKTQVCPFYTKQICYWFSSFLVTLTDRIVKCSVGAEQEAFSSPFT